MKHGKTRKRNVLRVYEEGLCYLNYFITWDNLKSISWPKSFQASGIGNRIFYRSPSRSDTLKIMDKNEKVYLVEVSDKEGLSEIIKKRKKIK